ncbi:hypothetical protein N825_04850 [Skermanella stibiiresistens SB22]|uniref:Uncharacterized protein n=1 Tax=Skermanella stibiiresistens SB22 TaxID=1385369 RepID=W9H1G8_9PROT|nr:hypothetical protein [Skermanella stibiiresistens]EWY39914.1 hypothetical protein N825_04850 [Skermanella stibiiresistens SB22]
MNRRELLGTVAATGLIAAIPTHSGATGLAGVAAVPPQADQLLGLLRSRAAARRIGRAYLETASHEADAAQLVSLILGDDAVGVDRVGDLRHRVAELQRADFTAGRTVTLDGWVLSRTEARLCALAAV